MRSIRIVFFEPRTKPLSEFIVVFWCAFHPKEKLFFIGPERSFNQCVFIGAVFVDAMMRELEFLTECIKSSLKLESIVCLDEDRLKGKPGKHEHEGAHAPILIELIENDGLLVPGVDINDGIFIAGPGESRELGGHIFDIHLQIPNRMNILCVHMDRGLIPWTYMIAISMYQSFSFEYSVNRVG